MGSQEFFYNPANFASSVYMGASPSQKERERVSKMRDSQKEINPLKEKAKEDKKDLSRDDRRDRTVEEKTNNFDGELRTRDEEEGQKTDKKSGVRKRKPKKGDDLGGSSKNHKNLSTEAITLDSTREKKEGFEALEKKLREFDFYHGFMPREDLPFVLNNKGDYILRVSEVVEGEHKVKREIILSLIPISGKDEKDDCKSPRNVIIKRHNKKFFIEAKRAFHEVKDLIVYYTKNTGVCNSIVFQLKNPQLLQPWEFMHSNVTVGKILGEGAFGVVCAGTLKLKDGSVVDVAIKMTKNSTFLSKAKIKEMMNEARFIRYFNHKNVVKMYGVAHDEQPLYILLELIKGGSLKDHLTKNRGNLTMLDKLKFCLGAAKGIEYLHSMKCIHRDIAARNFLLNDNVVKITDFGLSRTGPNYKLKTSSKLPTKWLSPEVLSTLNFSYGSDVYSFGITCYEIFAEGAEPFEGVSNAVVKAEVTAGKFLQMPTNCPESIKKYISASVFVDVTKRASMSEIVSEFEKATVASEISVPSTPVVGTPANGAATTPTHDAEQNYLNKKLKFWKR